MGKKTLLRHTHTCTHKCASNLWHFLYYVCCKHSISKVRNTTVGKEKAFTFHAHSQWCIVSGKNWQSAAAVDDWAGSQRPQFTWGNHQLSSLNWKRKNSLPSSQACQLHFSLLFPVLCCKKNSVFINETAKTKPFNLYSFFPSINFSIGYEIV